MSTDEPLIAHSAIPRAFGEWCGRVAGVPPYAYQTRLAVEGLPDVLSVPTGSGKTLAAVLPWLFRRRVHPDPAVRAGTPRRLVVVLPQRSLVEQTHRVIAGWLAELGEPVGLHLMLGGASSDDRAWKRDPAADAVFVGTQDMVLSRLLLRGYGEPRSGWPMSFGLLHADTQFVFDEVQLMGPALPTSLQLAGLRAQLGEAAPCRSMWMSATVDPGRFDTPDFPGIGTRVGLADADRDGPLGRRLTATRRVAELAVDPKRYAASLGTEVVRAHRAGARTIVVCNTVDRAVQVFYALRTTARTVLLHSRFRPADRAAHLEAALADPGPDGTIVVSTQVLEAGVDVTSAVLVTEVAPWSSVVQRAGRCNRAGQDADARLLWVRPPGKSPAPYEEKDLARSAEALAALEGIAVTGSDLHGRAEEDRPLHAVLRRRDLLDLFDTAADLTGNDLDISRWIRDADTVTASVAWRGYGPDGPPEDAPAPGRAELCPAPLGELRDAVRARSHAAWLLDQVTGSWRGARPEDVRPGATLVLAADRGGYRPEIGWAPASTAPVEEAPLPVPEPVEAMTSDELSAGGAAVTLRQHGEDVEREAAGLLGALHPPGVGGAQRDAAVLAALLHDLGKAHPVFVDSMARAGAPAAGGPWAKSGTRARLGHRPPAFRHELVSALLVLHPDSGLLDGVAEPDLVAYLVAAHHGKVRLSARSLPDENPRYVLGVRETEDVGPIQVSADRSVPALTVRRDVLRLGGGEWGPSWTARACGLRDRLGPFRLAFLEAVVRVADWRASASYEEAGR